jgi:hypothetical protein
LDTHGACRVVRTAKLFSWREHLGEMTTPREWPAIIDEATGRALRELLARKTDTNGHRRRHLLSGILRCGHCGARCASAGSVVAPPLPEPSLERRRLRRHRDPARPHRHGHREDGGPPALVARDGRALAARRCRAKSTNEAEILTALAEVERERNSADRAPGEISRETFLSLQRALARWAEELSAKLAEQRRNEPLDALTPAGAKGIADRYRSFAARAAARRHRGPR